MRFSEAAKRDRKVDESIFVRDKGMTTDEIIYTLMLTKRKLNEQMFEIMKDSAIDCMLNALEHGSKSCFIIRSGGPLFLYDPDYRVDIAASSSTFRTTESDTSVSEVVPVLAAPEVAERSEASLPPGLSGAAETRMAEEVEPQALPQEQPQLNAVQELPAEAETNVAEALEANAAAQELQQQEGLNKPI